MNTAITNNPTPFNYYWNQLRDLSDEMKIALIAKLSSSMIHPKAKTTKTLGDYKGILAHTDSPTAEEIREVMSDEDKDYEKFIL